MEQFHDTFPPSKSKTIQDDVRGIFLKEKLLDSDIYLCSDISEAVSEYETGVAVILAAFYKRDALSVVIEIFQDSTDLMPLLRDSNDALSFFCCESCEVYRTWTIRPPARVYFCTDDFYGSSIDDADRITILSVAGGRQNVNTEATSYRIVPMIEYEEAT